MVLAIAGSDSSAGAGIQADLKTFSALGVYGATVITAVTAQNTIGVTAIHAIPLDMIRQQIEAVFADLHVAAIKIGMLGDVPTIAAVADTLEKVAPRCLLVLDPVMVATSGVRLLQDAAEHLLMTRLFPRASLITPNLPESAALLGSTIAANVAEMEAQARRLHGLGAHAVLLKGGHGHGREAIDVYYDGNELRHFVKPRLATRNTHGTGCTLSSAIAAYLVRGFDLKDAIAAAKTYLHEALLRADDLMIGKGRGPVSHFYNLETTPSHPLIDVDQKPIVPAVTIS